MNRLMKGLLGAVVISGALVGGKALAGYRSTTPVYVSQTFAYAYGALGDARAASDGNQYMSCSVRTGPSTSGPWAECDGQDSSDSYFYVWSSDASVIATVESLKGDSYLWIAWDQSTSVIQEIIVYNGSLYTPKGP